MIVDCALYEDGKRRPGHLELSDACEAGREPGCFVWIGLHHPTPQEFDAVREEFGVHELVVEDAIKAHQRPKLEVYDDMVFMVLKTAEYDDEEERIRFAELQVFVGEGFVVTVRHGEASALAEVRRELESSPDLLRCGPIAVLHAVADRVVDDYMPVVDGIEVDIDQVELEVFGSEHRNSAQRIYELKRSVLDFHRNTVPLGAALTPLARGSVPHSHMEMTDYFRDVVDHLSRVVTRIESASDVLSDALSANQASIGVRQNEDMRTISAWAAVIAVPTMLAGIWGMNFRYMPELEWRIGYPLALLTIFVSAGSVYRRLKQAGWL